MKECAHIILLLACCILTACTTKFADKTQPTELKSEPTRAEVKKEPPVEDKKISPPLPENPPEVEKPLPFETKTDPAMASVDKGLAITSLMTVKDKVKLRKSPANKAGVVKTLHKGDIVKIIKQKEEWFLVEFFLEGSIGWCHKSMLKKLEES